MAETPYCAASGCLNKSQGLLVMAFQRGNSEPQTISAELCKFHAQVYTFVAGLMDYLERRNTPPAPDPHLN